MEVWEEGMILKDLLESHDVNQKQLANLTGRSRSWISRRLSLVSKIDEEVSAMIRMGTLTSSHARVLMRLPRGNQINVARIIFDHDLNIRFSNRLVDAYLAAEDTDQQQDILSDPTLVLWGHPDYHEDLYDRDYDYDERLSAYGNNLRRSLEGFLRPVRLLLSELGDYGIKGLKESEQVIIDPFLKKVSNYTERLSRTIHQIKQQ